MYLLSNGFGHIHTSHVSRVAEILWEMILLYIRTIIQMIFPYFTDLPLVVNHPWGRPQTSFMKLSPHWPPQHTKLGILWSGLNINFCHSRATADSQAHSRVFCGESGTNLDKYFKPEGFYYCKPAGLWLPICSCIQTDLTEFHQGKVIQEISFFLHLCVAVLSGSVDWHWLWGIDTIYNTPYKFCMINSAWAEYKLCLLYSTQFESVF